METIYPSPWKRSSLSAEFRHLREPALVSVVIPTYNRRAYVQEAVESALAQTYEFYEIIVVDDGSTDGTGSHLLHRYGDRIRYVWQENHGESVARNRGVEMAQGEYIAFLDSDDVWEANKLAKQTSALGRFREVDILFSSARVIDARGKLSSGLPLFGDLRTEDIALERLLVENMIWPSTLLMKKDLFEALGGFDTTIRYGEDWSLVLRAFLRGAMILYLRESLVRIRRHHDSQCHYPSSERIDQFFVDHLKILECCFNIFKELVPESLQNMALANQYIEASLAYQVVGWDEKSFNSLKMAVSIDLDVMSDVSLYGRHIVNYAADYARDSEGRADWTKADEFVVNALARRTQCVGRDEVFERKVCARNLVAMAFYLRDKEELEECKKSILRAIHSDPMSLKNTGFALMAIEVFAGSSVASWIKRIGRKLLLNDPINYILVDTRVMKDTS